MDTASTAIDVLKTGKTENGVTSSNSNSKEKFEDAVKEYFTILESVSVNLRKEVRLLHLESKEKVLPISLAAKAEWVGKNKEEQVSASIEQNLQKFKQLTNANTNNPDI